MSASTPAPASTATPQLLLELVSHSSDALLVVAADWRIVAVNRHAAEMLAMQVTALAGVDLWELLPEDLAPHHRVRADLAVEMRKAYRFEVDDRFSGSAITLNLTPLGGQVLVALADASALRRAAGEVELSRARYRALFEANPHPMWIIDTATLRILMVNRAAVRAYGHSREAFLEMTVTDLYLEEDQANLAELLPDVEGAPDARRPPRLCRHRLASGQDVLVEVSGHQIEHDGVPAVLMTAVDVTQQLLAQSRIQQLNEELQAKVEQLTEERDRSNKEIEAFIYAVSHDLRNPLHVADGFAQILVQRHSQQLDDRGRHYTERIMAATRQIGVVLDALLILSRVPRTMLRPEPVDLAVVSQGIIDALRKREPARVVDLELDPELTLTCDRHLMTTALTCLLDNAWKFTGRKEQGWIHVSLAREGGHALLSVSDNGIGFDPAFTDKLFQPFQRLHSVADFPGAGLGLVIVQRIAARHGGMARATAEPDKGAVFQIVIPLDGAEPADLPTERAPLLP